jgi:hypothetical protein
MAEHERAADEETEEVVYLGDAGMGGLTQPMVLLPPPPPISATVPLAVGQSGAPTVPLQTDSLQTDPLSTSTVPLPAGQSDSHTVPIAPDHSGSATVPLSPGQPVAATLPLSVPLPPSGSGSGSASEGQTVVSTVPVPTRPLLAGRRRRRLWIAAPVLVALVAGGLVAFHFLSGTSRSGPEAAVDSYFQDLESGDAKDAAALAVGPYAGKPVIAPQTLADAARRPSGLTIVSSSPVSASVAEQDREDGVEGRDLTVVSVKYTVHGTVVSDSFLAEQDAKSSKWELVDPYRQMQVDGGWSSTVILDGVSVDETALIEAFPGEHVVSDPASPDFGAESVTVAPTRSAADGDSLITETGFGEVTLPDPHLSSAGQAAVQTAYRSALDACAIQAETGFSACGLDDTFDGNTCNHVTWTITSVGQAQVDLTEPSDEGGFPMDASGSTASESGDYSDFFGFDHSFQNQSAELEDSEGSIVFHSDGSATVTLTS